jgi:Flagellar hook-length control protein FliK
LASAALRQIAGAAGNAAVRDRPSGTFLETNLAQVAQQAAPAATTPNIATDLKALMLTLGRALQTLGSDSWTVEAAMDLGTIGALHAKVSLTGRRIGVQLRAESPVIVEELSMRAGELEALLRESGLEIDRVVCLHGMPAGDNGARTTRLLDVRA